LEAAKIFGAVFALICTSVFQTVIAAAANEAGIWVFGVA
jgi:hypothetical protein